MIATQSARTRTVASVVALGLLSVGMLLAIVVTRQRPAAGLVLLLVAPLLLLLLTTRRDAAAVLTLFLIMLFALPARLVVGPLGAAGTPATIVGLAAAWWWAHGKLVPSLGLAQSRQPVRMAILVFFCCMLLGYAAGFARPIDGVETRAADRGMITLVGLVGVALLAADGIERRARLDRLLRRIVLAGAFLAAIGMVQFFFGIDLASYIRVPGLSYNADLAAIAERSIFRRVAGTATHAIEYGVVLAMIFPLALHYAFHAQPGAGRVRRWGCTAMIAVAIPMSVSRSSVVAIAAGMLVLATSWSWRRRLNAAVATVVFLGAMRAAIPGLLGTIKALFLYTEVDPSIQGRKDDFPLVREFVVESPVFGRGFGTLLPERYFFLDNQYLGTLVETGFVGLLSLALVLVVGASVARGARRRSADASTRSLGQALAASVVIAAVSLATFDGLSFRMTSGLLFLLIGCAGALWRFENQPHPPHPIDHRSSSAENDKASGPVRVLSDEG